jgi:hypothetical protein
LTCETTTHATTGTGCPDSYNAGLALVGNSSATSPVQPSTPRSQLFLAVLNCVHSTHCAIRSDGSFSDTDCYCGAGVDPNSCFGGTVTPTGVCKTQIEAATESNVLGDVNNRFFDPTFAIGAATTVLETCDQFDCGVGICL